MILQNLSHLKKKKKVLESVAGLYILNTLFWMDVLPVMMASSAINYTRSAFPVGFDSSASELSRSATGVGESLRVPGRRAGRIWIVEV